MNKIIILIDRKPERAVYEKVEDHDKVTTSVRHIPLRASSHQKISDSKHLHIKDSEQGQFKVIMKNNGYCVQCTPPLYIPFSKKFQRSVEPRHWQVTTQFIKFESVPIYLELLFFLFAKFLLFLMAILKAKIFKIQNFLHLLKSVNNKYTLFELVSRWSVHQHPSRERLHSGRETWLSTLERTSALSKMQSHSKNIYIKKQKQKIYKKELTNLKTWKGGLVNRERLGGLKTPKDGQGKN